MSLRPNLYTVSEGDRVEVMLVTNIPYVFEFTIMVNTNSVTAMGTYVERHSVDNDDHQIQYCTHPPFPQMALTLKVAQSMSASRNPSLPMAVPLLHSGPSMIVCLRERRSSW